MVRNKRELGERGVYIERGDYAGGRLYRQENKTSLDARGRGDAAKSGGSGGGMASSIFKKITGDKGTATNEHRSDLGAWGVQEVASFGHKRQRW